MALGKNQNQKQGAAAVALAFTGGRALVQQGVFVVPPEVVAGSVAENLGGWLVDGSWLTQKTTAGWFIDSAG